MAPVIAFVLTTGELTGFIMFRNKLKMELNSVKEVKLSL
jgi:hypothetical protein